MSKKFFRKICLVATLLLFALPMVATTIDGGGKIWILVSICVVCVFRLPVIDKGYEAKSLFRHGTCANRTDGVAFYVPSNYYRNNY